jgi:hypothetical protein
MCGFGKSSHYEVHTYDFMVVYSTLATKIYHTCNSKYPKTDVFGGMATTIKGVLPKVLNMDSNSDSPAQPA